MNEFVISTTKEVQDLIFTRIRSRENHKEIQTWLLYGRIISLLFVQHFKMAYQVAEAEICKKENAETSEGIK